MNQFSCLWTDLLHSMITDVAVVGLETSLSPSVIVQQAFHSYSNETKAHG